MAWTNALFTNVLTPAAFGARGDGVTNDTVAVQSFLNALQNGGIGNWNNASYLVNEGTLILHPSSNAADTYGPTIYGHAKFIASGAADAPILQIWNTSAPSSGFPYYRSGNFGTIEFTDNLSSGSNRHGLSASGLFGWRGTVIGNNLHGSVITVPSRTSPGIGDNYEVFDCYFDVVNNNSVNTVLNNNAADGGGINSDHITSTSSSDCYVSAGVQNMRVRGASIGTTSGYAFKFPSGAGSGNRVSIFDCELDTCHDGGLFIASLVNFEMRRLRIAVRNISGVTQPTKACITIGNGTSGGDIIWGGIIDAQIKLLPPVTTSNVTPALDCTNTSNIIDLTVYLTINDQTGLFPTTTSGLGSLLVKNVRTTVTPMKVFINGASYISQ